MGYFKNLVDEFFINGKINAYVQENFICLIQKKLDAVPIKDYRPISFTPLSYKVAAKVLAEWLKLIMDSIKELFKVPLSEEDRFWIQF